jgi:hypothetical protein
VESQCQAAQSEVAQLKEKMAGLDHVLRVSFLDHFIFAKFFKINFDIFVFLWPGSK